MSTTKRWRSLRMIPNTLRAGWGKLRHGKPDMLFSYGPGCSGADARLLNHALFDVPTLDSASLMEELEKRGYDITTLKFSIQKKVEIKT